MKTATGMLKNGATPDVIQFIKTKIHEVNDDMIPLWLEQTLVMDHWEGEYDGLVPHCKHVFAVLDDQTAACDALQLQSEGIDDSEQDAAHNDAERSKILACRWLRHG